MIESTRMAQSLVAMPLSGVLTTGATCLPVAGESFLG